MSDITTNTEQVSECVQAKNALTQALTKEFTRRGITVDITFVPFSRSRNRAEKNRSLNWSIQLMQGGKPVFDTDYMQGVGHIPDYPHNERKTLFFDGWESGVIETGRFIRYATYKKPYGTVGPGKLLPKPDIADVFYSLLLDSEAVNYSGFEQWASEYGYETDSRAAEKVYRACLDIGLKINGLFGAEMLAKWRELSRGM